MQIQIWSRERFSRWLQTIAAVALVSIATAVAPVDHASAYTLKTLHNFCSLANCNDGRYPGLDSGVRDQSGIIYGTTLRGGKYDGGVVFKLVLNANKTKWTEHVLKNFCAKANCADGEKPYNDLIFDTDGSLYGTTASGGKYGLGTIFRLTPNGLGWSFAILHNFCAHSGCPDGSLPQSALVYAGKTSGAPWDKASPLFGTTLTGGQYDDGAAFQLVHNGATWSETVIHSFHNTFDNNGYSAPTTLVMDAAGNLYGVTTFGGKFGGGLLYKLAHDTWTQTVFHNFCNTANCADGKAPYGSLFMDAAGNIFGTTAHGGANTNSTYCVGDIGCGVAFEYTSSGIYNVIYNFCSRTNCNDGANPIAGLVMDSSGHLFGTTVSGGLGLNLGVAFLLIGSGGSWAESVAYPFCSLANCADGQAPEGPLYVDAAGDLWGLVGLGGTNSAGTAFELTP